MGARSYGPGYDQSMPIYEFRCRTCGTRFEQLRPVDGSSVATAACPQGHEDVERLLSMIAPTPSSESGGGACCASGCACGRN